MKEACIIVKRKPRTNNGDNGIMYSKINMVNQWMRLKQALFVGLCQFLS